MAQNKGVLAATSGLPVSELSKARVQPGSALWQRLLQLAVPSCDALDAARAASVLITLAGDSFVAALGLAGVSILRADLVPRIKEGEDLGWLRHIIGLAEDNEAGALLLAAAEEVRAPCGKHPVSPGRRCCLSLPCPAQQMIPSGLQLPFLQTRLRSPFCYRNSAPRRRTLHRPTGSRRFCLPLSPFCCFAVGEP